MSSAQELVDGLARRIGRPVALDDAGLRLVAYSAHGGEVDDVRRGTILGRAASPGVAAWMAAHGVRPGLTSPVRLAAEPSLGMAGRVCVPVGAAGFLWLADEPGRAVGDDEVDAAVSLVPELLAALAPGDPAERALRAALAGEPDPLATLLRVPAPWTLSVGGATSAADGVGGLVDDLWVVVGRASGGSSSAPFSDLQDVPEAHAQARAAARVAALRGVEALDWEACGADGPLARLEDDALALLARSVELERLAAHDKDGTLARTLLAWLDRGSDAAATAAALVLHRASLYHRLKRIEELAAVDLADGDTRLRLHLALRAARLRG